MKNCIKLTFILLIQTLLFGCQKSVDLPVDLIAQVNDSYLRKNNVNNSVPADLPVETKLSMKKMIIKQWVENEIVYQSAVKEGLQWSDDELFLIEKYKKALLIQRFLDNKLNKNFRISQKEIEDNYNDNIKEFIRKNDEVHIVHLLIENRDNAIFNEINESDDLKEIIKKYYFDIRSTYESPNGDLGYVVVSSLPDFLQNILRNLKTGAISKFVKSEYGYHFVQLLDKQKKGSQVDIELVKDEIVRRLKWLKREQEYVRLMDELKEKYQVQTYLSKVQ
jgi:parvulin-like peptidyl-prolyl isomerase